MPPRTRHLYVARDRGQPRIKVGISEEPSYRLRMLEYEHGVRLDLIGVIRGANYDDERWMHRILARWSVGGEWYEPDVLPLLMPLFDRDLTELVRDRRRTVDEPGDEPVDEPVEKGNAEPDCG